MHTMFIFAKRNYNIYDHVAYQHKKQLIKHL